VARFGTGATRVIHEKIEDYRNTGYGFYHDSDAMRWEFIRRCATGRPPLQDPRDAWRSHIVCMAADESGEEDGRRVTVDYTEGPKSLRWTYPAGRRRPAPLPWRGGARERG